MGLTNNLKNTRMKEKIVKRKNNFSESEAAMELKKEKVENMTEEDIDKLGNKVEKILKKISR